MNVQELEALAPKSGFLASILSQHRAGRRLSERQITVASEIIAKLNAPKPAPVAAPETGTIGIDAINALFQTALDNGLKKPQFRTRQLTVKLARLHSDTLYITGTANDTYYGKVYRGEFLARREAPHGTLGVLQAIAADPLRAAVEYGRSTGNCACCGRGLTDPTSVELGIGPICKGKWNL